MRAPRTQDAAGVTVQPREAEIPPGSDRPGEVLAEPTIELWPDDAADGLRARWRELQLRFVDDPQGAAAGADAVLAETIETLSGGLQSARANLSEWRTKDSVDTEGLRVVVQRYRSVLDRVLAL